MTNPTLERVARAIYAKSKHVHLTEVSGRAAPLMREMEWEELPENTKQHELHCARAALLALKEVDEGTVEAVWQYTRTRSTEAYMFAQLGSAEEVQKVKFLGRWTAAIDHILEQGA